MDKVNAFYLQKEAELRNRLDTLVEKRKLLQAGNQLELRLSATFIVLQEGFQQFERDLNKLQVSKGTCKSYYQITSSAICRTECDRILQGIEKMG